MTNNKTTNQSKAIPFSKSFLKAWIMTHLLHWAVIVIIRMTMNKWEILKFLTNKKVKNLMKTIFNKMAKSLKRIRNLMRIKWKKKMKKNMKKVLKLRMEKSMKKRMRSKVKDNNSTDNNRIKEKDNKVNKPNKDNRMPNNKKKVPTIFQKISNQSISV